jgi:hypothetical protein
MGASARSKNRNPAAASRRKIQAKKKRTALLPWRGMPATSLDEITCPLKGLSWEACEDIDFFKDKGSIFLLADLSRMTVPAPFEN